MVGVGLVGVELVGAVLGCVRVVKLASEATVPPAVRMKVSVRTDIRSLRQSRLRFVLSFLAPAHREPAGGTGVHCS